MKVTQWWITWPKGWITWPEEWITWPRGGSHDPRGGSHDSTWLLFHVYLGTSAHFVVAINMLVCHHCRPLQMRRESTSYPWKDQSFWTWLVCFWFKVQWPDALSGTICVYICQQQHKNELIKRLKPLRSWLPSEWLLLCVIVLGSSQVQASCQVINDVKWSISPWCSVLE